MHLDVLRRHFFKKEETQKMLKKNVARGMVLWLVVLFGMGIFAGCGDKYSDVIKVNKKFIAVMEDFSAAMDTVESAEDAVSALDAMAESMEELAPEIKALNEKFPELRTREGLPEELASLQTEAEQAGRNYANSVMQLMPYMTDPQVQEAQRRVARAMSQMQ